MSTDTGTVPASEVPVPAPEPGVAGITVSGVTRSFGAVKALQGVDLTAPAGAITALVGPNGSGKTTLMLVLASLLKPDAGSVTIAGADPEVDPGAVRRNTGWMPDTLGVWESLTAREILVTMGRFYGLDRDRVRSRAGQLLEWQELATLADQPARVLSRGQQQRLSLARALIHDPQVLLLDEPASGLDPGSRIRLRDDLKQMAASGKTILVSSHVLSELDEMADLAVFIQDGATVRIEDLSRDGAAGGRYLITALDVAALHAALEHYSIAFRPAGRRQDSVSVEMASAVEAADMLATLVGAGVRVLSFTPGASRLETTYLELDRMRSVDHRPAGNGPADQATERGVQR
ncbi:ABC transporter ATP-binding protein [Microbacterium sp. A93]|uniref:ABC transporter ATP-binding protein n=1 Tax=Microbacterium sp. A93 TaxID=3450716 RepID=UPI003F43B0DB